MAGNRIQFDVGFNVNKQDLNSMLKSFAQIKQEINGASAGNLTKELKNAGEAANKLENIINSAWNEKLNQLDLGKFNSEIKKSFGSLSNLKQVLSQAGPAGAASFNTITSSIYNTNVQIKQSNKLLNDMAVSMANTVKWGVTSSVFNTVTGAIKQAYGYTKKLDSSLNDIRIVTDKSADSMTKFAAQANKAAKELGAATLDYTNASLIYYQQGLSDEEVKARTDTTLKAANVTGQSGEAVSEQLTAVWNGYKVTAEETEQYVDKLAAVAATTASDLEELSTGMSKVASAANSMGVDVDQLNAQLSTIISVTRQAPESVGTALKTIYARLGDLKVDGVDEFGTKLGEVSAQLQVMGIEILDQQGNLRDIGGVIEEVASKWNIWTEAQRQAAAVAIAGKRQYNNLIALFDNWDMYTKALETSQNAMGTLSHQQDIYMESTESHLQKLKTEAENTYDILFDQDVVNGFTSALTGVLSIFNTFLNTLGGGASAFLTLGAIGVRVFNQQIGGAIAKAKANAEAMKANIEQLKAVLDASQTGYDTTHMSEDEKKIYEDNTARVRDLIDARKYLTEEESIYLNGLREEIFLAEQEIFEIEKVGKANSKRADGTERTALMIAEEIQAEDRFLKESKKLNQDLEKSRRNILAIDKQIETIKSSANINEEEINNLTKRREEYLQSSKNALANINILYGEELSIEEQIGVLEQNEVLTEGQINDLNLEIRNKNLEHINNQIKLNKELALQEQYEAGINNNLRDRIALQQSEYKTKVGQAKNAGNYSDITKGITSIITLGTVAHGIFKTLEDDSQTLGEKLGSIAVTLSFSLPMLIGSFGSMKAAATAAGTAITKALAAVGVVGTAAIAAVAAVVVAVVAAVAAIGIHIYKVKTEHKRMAKEMAKEVETLKAKYDEAAQSFNDFKQTISDYQQAVNGIEALKDKTDELKEAIEQANEKARELIETYNLFGDYTIDENGLIVFKEGVLENIEQQKRQDTANTGQNLATSQIANNTAQQQFSTDNFIKELKNQNIFLTEEELKQITKVIENLVNNGEEVNIANLWKYAPESVKKYGGQQGTVKLIAEGGDDLVKEFLNYAKDLKTTPEKNQYEAEKLARYKTTENFGDQIRQTATRDEETDEILAEHLTNVLAKINYDKAIPDLTNVNANDIKSNSDLRKIKGYENVNNDKDLAKRYAEEILGIDNVSNLKYKNHINSGEFKDNQGNTIMEKTSDDQMRRALAIKARTEAILDEVLSNEEGAGQASMDTLNKIVKLGEETGEKLGFDFTNAFLTAIENQEDGQINFSDLVNQFNPDEVGAFDNLSNQEIANRLGLGNLSSEDWQNLGFESAEVFGQAFREALEEYDVVAWADQKLEQLHDQMDKASGAADTLLSGKTLSEEEISGLEDLEKKYEELGLIRDRESKEYLSKLLEIREALEQEAIKTQELKASASIDEAQEKLIKLFDSEESENELEEFQDTLQDLCDKEYSVLVEIKADTQDDFDTVVSAMDEIEEMASKIGDDYIVAAEDLEELNDVFPGILDNIDFLDNGTAKLSKDVVEQAMAAAKEEVAIDTDKTVQKLRNAQEEVRLKKDAAKRIYEIAHRLAEGQSTLDQERENLTKAMGDFEINTSEQVTDKGQDDQEDLAQTAADASESMARNFGNAYEAMSADAVTWAGIAHQAVLSASDPNVPPPENGLAGSMGASFRSTVKISNDTSNKLSLDNFESFSNEDWSKTEKAYEELYKSLEEQDNNYSGKIAELIARGKKNNEEFNNIAKGFGSDGKDDDASKSKKEKTITPKEEEVFKPDLYYEIEKAIKSVDRAIQQLEDDEKNLYGKAKIKALKEENKLLDQQLNNLKEKQKIQQQEANDLRSKLSAGGVSFSANGEVQNYNQSLESATEKYNSVIRQYNAGLVDDEQVKAAKKVLDDFKSDLDRYSKLFYDEMPELIKEMRAKIKEQLSNNLEGFELKFELKLEKKQAAREWRNFVYEMKKDFKKVYEDLDKDMARLIKNSKTYTQKNKGTIAVDLKEIKEVQKEINKLNKGKPSDKFENISQAQEKLKELNERLQEHGEELHQLYEDAWNNYLAQIDQAKSKFEDINGVLDRTESKMNTLIQLEEKLYGGTKTYQMRITNAQREYDFAKARVQVAKTEYDLNKELWEKSGATMDNMSSWNEDQKKYYENMVAAEETMLENLEKGVEAAEKKMIASIEKIHDDLEKTFTNGFGFDELNEQWEWIDREASEYYDTIEQGYEVQKLNNQITQDAIGMSIKGQEKLKKFQNEEIKKLREKDKLSKYELKRAQAMYDITLKEIALEEARNNKSAMKLTRNSEGNWSYQYVADEGDVTKKQQDLLDAQMNFRQLAKEEEERLLKEQLKLQQEYNDKATALYSEFQEKYGKDDSEWDEEQKTEFENAQKRLNERYSKALTDIETNVSMVRRDLMAGDYTVQQTLWSQLGSKYKELVQGETEDFKRFSDSTLTNFTTLYNAIVGGEEGEGGLKGIGKTAEEMTKKADEDFNTMIINQCQNTNKLTEAVKASWAAEQKATQDYIAEVKQIGDIADLNLGKKGIEGDLDKIKVATDAAKEAAADLANEYRDTLPAAAEQVKSLETAWKKVVKQIQNAHKKLKSYLKLKNKENTKLDDASVNNVDAGGSVGDSSGGDDLDTTYSGTDSYGEGSVDNSSKEEGVAAAIWLQGASTSGWGNDPERAQKFAEKGVSGAQAIINAQGPSGQLYAKWKDRRAELSSYYYGAFDTGGYTGNWTGEGRFAMLHQKELVLNAEDTKNFLTATDSLRDLVSLDSSIEQTIANAISKMLVSMSTNNLNNLNSLRSGDSNTNNVFNINAEFPNANDVTEIREAILSLPNLANQYISKQRI